MLGTVSVHLTEARTGAAEESYFEMVSTFASSQACPNVSSVDLSAPHQALDARFLRVLGEHRPLIKKLDITAWSYLPLEEGESKWRGFEQLQTVNIKLADGKDFPNCFDDLLKISRDCQRLSKISTSRTQGLTMEALTHDWCVTCLSSGCKG